jgi:hypothetical protein
MPIVAAQNRDPVLAPLRLPPAARSAVAFFAQDHASTEMAYANADVTKRAAANEILAFADHWKKTSGSDLVVFDSRLTTYAVLEELNAGASTG